MQRINTNTVVVYNYTELKSALENTTDTFVYLGSDITLTNGIKINASKTSVIIDGTYQGVTYTLTDNKSTAASDTIYIASSNNKAVTVENLNFVGYNYYGIIYVPDSSTYSNTILTYKNITYVGPQICFHPYGLTKFIDCDITIQDNYSVGNEVAECNRIAIGGSTSIMHKSTANSGFWFRNSNPSLTILEGAKVNFTSTSREFIYGVTNLVFTIEKNASFYVTAANGFAYQSFGTGLTKLCENATFVLKKTSSNGAYATWYSYGHLYVLENATLEIINDYTGLTTSNHNITFPNSSGALNLVNPLKVLLYNKVADVINVVNKIPFNFSFTRINMFSVASLFDSEDFPEFSWYKDSEVGVVNGSLTSSATTITENNFTEEELTKLPALSNFKMQGKKILSIGTMPLMISAITDVSLEIKGLTVADSFVKINYLDVDVSVKALYTGRFTYQHSDTIPIGTEVTFNVKYPNDFIYITKVVTVIYPGEISIVAPDKITFLLEPISSEPLICPKASEVNIIIDDTRIDTTSWYLYASVSKDLTSSDDYSLPKSLVFQDSEGNYITLSDVPTLIYSDESLETPKTTTITMATDKGILLNLNTPIRNNTLYTTDITWRLEQEKL